MSSLAVAIIVLALAIGGAAVAIVVSQKSSPLQLSANTGDRSTGNETPTGSVTSSSQEENVEPAGSSSPSGAEPEGGAESPPDSKRTGLLPADESNDQMAPEIQGMLRQFHEDIVSGDYRSAWNLMSARKQHQSLQKYGYPGWVKNQSTLRPYLDPSGLTVNVQDSNPSNGVATVDVTGMRWNKPGSSCSEWSGITWVKYEGGAWRYDPGYSTSPQRESEWKSRYAELLGGRC